MRVRFPGEGRGGIVSSPGGVERSDPLALWERVRVRVSHQGYAKVSQGASEGEGLSAPRGGVERSDPLALWERVRVRVSHQGYAKVSQGAPESEGLSAPQRGEGGFLVLRRARDCQLPGGGVERSDPLALWERVRVRVSHQGYAKVSQGASEGEGLSAPQRGEGGFLALRRARDCQLPKGERGDSWLSGERGIVSSPKGRGGILGSPESEGLSAPRGGVERSDPLALWERVRVRVSHQGYAKVSQGAKARAKGNPCVRLTHMDMRSRARELRRASTDAERAFWRQVRGRGLGGHKFRRQVPIGPYIADLLCLQARLIIEFDGGHHQEQTAADERRTQWLESEGYRVLRLWDNDVLLNITGALETVLAALGNPQGNGQGQPSP